MVALGPIILVYSQTNREYDLFFDDGEADALFSADLLLNQVAAVKFRVTPKHQVMRLRYYVGGGSSTVKAHVLDKNFRSVYSESVTPEASDNLRWYEVDISEENLKVDGDFFVGLEWTEEGKPQLGVDETSPHHARSYLHSLGSSGSPITDGDFMIRVVVSDLATGELFEVTLTIIDPEGEAAFETLVYVYKGYPSRSKWELRGIGWTDEDGKVTLQLRKGPHFVAVWRPYTRPKFWALSRLYVNGAGEFEVEVSEVTIPVTLVATKPLEGRPFTEDSYFDILVLNYPEVGQPHFSSDTPGFVRVYLPKNLKYSIAFEDEGSLYVLFTKSMVLKKVGTTITFDASQTGFARPVFRLPTDTMSEDIDSLGFTITGKDMPRIFLYVEYGEEGKIAVTTGKYEVEVRVYYYREEEKIYESLFIFKAGSISIKSKKVVDISYGGDLTGILKPRKGSYKVGEVVELDYSFEDLFKKKLIRASTWIMYEDSDLAEWYYRPLYLNVYDINGLVDSERLDWYGPYGTISLRSPLFSEPGTYTIELVLNTGPYQGIVTTSTTINVGK